MTRHRVRRIPRGFSKSLSPATFLAHLSSWE